MSNNECLIGKSKLTSDPEQNIKLGSYYFNSLLNEYKEVYPFDIAAYNAGLQKSETLKKLMVTQVKEKLIFVNWIELIKFKETRNYVQKSPRKCKCLQVYA